MNLIEVLELFFEILKIKAFSIIWTKIESSVSPWKDNIVFGISSEPRSNKSYLEFVLKINSIVKYCISNISLNTQIVLLS